MAYSSASTMPIAPQAYSSILETALKRYNDILIAAAPPLAARLQAAYQQFVAGQAGIGTEMAARITTAYQGFSDQMGTVLGGSRLLEPTVASYRRYAEALGAYMDFSRLSQPVAEAQHTLNSTLKAAAGQADAAGLAADAVAAFSGALNRLLTDDPQRLELAAALNAYAEQLGALQADMLAAGQGAIDSLTEALERIVDEVNEAARAKSLLDSYIGEIGAINSGLAEAHEAAVQGANACLHDGLAKFGMPVDPMPAPAAAFMASPTPPVTTAAAEATDMPMTASDLPRAAWVDIPPPPTRAWQASATTEARDADADDRPETDAGDEDPSAAKAKPRRTRPPSGKTSG